MAALKRNRTVYQQGYYEANKERLKQTNADHAVKLRRRNQRHIYDFLLQHPCIDCGETDPVVLDFDHRDGVEKLGTISNMAICKVSIKRLQAEMDKCDVRCANCHRRRTAVQNNWFVRTSGLKMAPSSNG